MTPEQLEQIFKHYGYAPAAIQAVQKGYRNESYAAAVEGGSTLNIIVYKREPHILERIYNAHYVAGHLTQKGLTARVPADRRIMRLQNERSLRYAALYTYLPGVTIPWEAYTKEHIKQLGRHMRSMHAALADLPRADLPAVTMELMALTCQMHTYFAQSGVRQALLHKLGVTLEVYPRKYGRLFELMAERPGQQPLHMDFVRGNILFEPGSRHITGVLDFEKTAWGVPVFDVARTLAFLLVDCKYKTPAQVYKYFLVSGYNKRSGSSATRGRLLEALTTFFLLHDFYKFLRHNPYESLADNEHFARTKDFLLARRIISTQQ